MALLSDLSAADADAPHSNAALLACSCLAVLVLSIWAACLLLVRGKGCRRSFMHAAERVLLVFAHPDDEVMFFTPTLAEIQRLNQGRRRRNESEMEVHWLCLSTGNYDGLGGVRSNELMRSAESFAVPADRVCIVDEADLQDGWAEWPTEATSNAVFQTLIKVRPDTILTFDEWGVSGHPNHRAVGKAIKSLYERMNPSARLGVYRLISTPLVRKYIGMLDVPLSWCLDRRVCPSPRPSPPSPSSLLAPPGSLSSRPKLELRALDALQLSPLRALRGMMNHRSQLVWYRYLFVFFSRYVYINTYERLLPPPPAKPPALPTLDILAQHLISTEIDDTDELMDPSPSTSSPFSHPERASSPATDCQQTSGAAAGCPPPRRHRRRQQKGSMAAGVSDEAASDSVEGDNGRAALRPGGEGEACVAEEDTG
ncbi:unnamed protein product [Vitrella brassicaformis CCMP3155]|uniref:N-acetylglucosaminylphosphatidylinositol deacetylase n=1 Tax=Vitrella brassicaformis (strain CCMP3155) TaxID=1169540 RepID=A0A0G4G911_VITBC|nr:unnamed protein product [Vitrella brassicaformis CCMP3155]|mmetsp:Transcript_20546/g.58699  ORF Transcript_20546/g.58699 Transcript_20546/m.58699 type:complete len:426 (-) Transcript_20546:227-1504(-)|eukprot:CEM25307.1 unnamed protein product [Vitrella brassicaformis CCMP3155]